jgi:hypothetical protein
VIDGYELAFTKAGTYNSICTVHDHMKARWSSAAGSPARRARLESRP